MIRAGLLAGAAAVVGRGGRGVLELCAGTVTHAKREDANCAEKHHHHDCDDHNDPGFLFVLIVGIGATLVTAAEGIGRRRRRR